MINDEMMTKGMITILAGEGVTIDENVVSADFDVVARKHDYLVTDGGAYEILHVGQERPIKDLDQLMAVLNSKNTGSHGFRVYFDGEEFSSENTFSLPRLNVILQAYEQENPPTIVNTIVSFQKGVGQMDNFRLINSPLSARLGQILETNACIMRDSAVNAVHASYIGTGCVYESTIPQEALVTGTRDSYVQLENCTVTGVNRSGMGLRALAGSYLRLNATQISNFDQGIYASLSGTVEAVKDIRISECETALLAVNNSFIWGLKSVVEVDEATCPVVADPPANTLGQVNSYISRY